MSFYNSRYYASAKANEAADAATTPLKKENALLKQKIKELEKRLEKLEANVN